MAQKTPEQIVSESGTGFQCKVATAFREEGWKVMLSPYYVDSATGKAREFDLLCEKEVIWSDAFKQKYHLWLQLFVECKYIAQPVVFWFDTRDSAQAKRWITSNTLFRSDNGLWDEHHYLQGKAEVAKLFASGTGRQEENDPIYKALAQCLGALTQSDWEGTHTPSALAQVKEGTRYTTLRYPVIVHSGSSGLHRAEVMSGDGSTTPFGYNFLLEVNYAYFNSKRKRNEQEFFLIDVVNYSELGNFLEALDREIKATKYLLTDT